GSSNHSSRCNLIAVRNVIGKFIGIVGMEREKLAEFFANIFYHLNQAIFVLFFSEVGEYGLYFGLPKVVVNLLVYAFVAINSHFPVLNSNINNHTIMSYCIVH